VLGIALRPLVAAFLLLPAFTRPATVAAGNRVTSKAWAQWERAHALDLRLRYGAAMVGLGVTILLWAID